MNLKEFNKLPDGKIFASGVLPNSSKDLFITKYNGKLKWVAKKGYEDDWTIYYHKLGHTDSWVTGFGKILTHKKHIQHCVPCDEEVMNRYNSEEV